MKAKQVINKDAKKQVKTQSKARYSKPELKLHGALQEITKVKVNGANDSGMS